LNLPSLSLRAAGQKIFFCASKSTKYISLFLLQKYLIFYLSKQGTLLKTALPALSSAILSSVESDFGWMAPPVVKTMGWNAKPTSLQSSA
jgi:hypothetical protein